MVINKVEAFFRARFQHYNHNRYWKYRERCIANRGGCKLINILRLLYIKRSDAYNLASMGTHLGYGASFAEPPILPHGIYGIIISHKVSIGKNCVIFHNVTIGSGNGGSPTIGDNVYIGAGAIIIGKITIGNNVKIGAGAIVTTDVPDNSTVVMNKPRIITKGA